VVSLDYIIKKRGSNTPQIIIPLKKAAKLSAALITSPLFSVCALFRGSVLLVEVFCGSPFEGLEA